MLERWQIEKLVFQFFGNSVFGRNWLIDDNTNIGLSWCGYVLPNLEFSLGVKQPQFASKDQIKERIRSVERISNANEFLLLGADIISNNQEIEKITNKERLKKVVKNCHAYFLISANDALDHLVIPKSIGCIDVYQHSDEHVDLSLSQVPEIQNKQLSAISYIGFIDSLKKGPHNE